MRKILVSLIGLIMTAPVLAQTGAIQQHCFKGGTKAVTSGLSSSNYLDGIIPSCTVTVYLTGTTTKATIFADGISTPLANPFTAHTSTSVDPGGWIFWAATNAGLDVVLSGGDAPNTYPTPVTLTDIFPSSSFTPVVAGLDVKTNGVDNTSQALLNFTDTASVKFTNPSGGLESATVPDGSNSTKGILKCDGTTTDCTGGTIVANHDVSIQTNGTPNTSQAILNHVDTASVKWSNPSGGIEEATADILNSLIMQTAPPAAGTYIRVDPSGFTLSGTGDQFSGAGSVTSADLRNLGCTLGGCTGAGPVQVVWTFTLPSYVNPANVTAVYGSSSAAAFPIGNNNGSGSGGNIFCTQGSTNFGLLPADAGAYGPYYQMQQFNALMTGVTGSQVSTVTCTAFVGSGSVVQAGLVLNVAQIYLQLADSVDTAPAANTIQVIPPLCYNSTSNSFALCFPIDVLTDTGAANAYVLTNLNFNLLPGSSFKMIPAHANTVTVPTVALNGSTVDIVGPTGGTIVANDIVTTAVAAFIVGLNGKAWLQNPQTPQGGMTTNALTAQASGGASPGDTFNGGAAKTWDYHTLGALPLNNPTPTGTLDGSGLTAEKLPVSAGCVTTANGNICYDSTNKNWHLWVNGVDKMLIPLAASFTSGHCGQPTLSGASWEIQDAGGACGVSGGGSAFSAITTGTNTTSTMTVGSGGSIVRSGTGIVDANQLNSVPFCTGFTPTNGQNLQYTTGSSPNPCYTAATAGGAGLTTPAFVQSAYQYGTTAGFNVTLGSTPTVGNTMIMVMVGSGGTFPLSGWDTTYVCSDSTACGNSFQAIYIGRRIVQSGDGTAWATPSNVNGNAAAIYEFSSSVNPLVNMTQNGTCIPGLSCPSGGASSGVQKCGQFLSVQPGINAVGIMEQDSSNTYSSIAGATLLFNTPASSGHASAWFTGSATTFGTQPAVTWTSSTVSDPVCFIVKFAGY